MKKTFAAFVAVATIAGSLMPRRPAPAQQRGRRRGVAGGLIGGAIVGGAIACQPPGRMAGPVYVEEPALPLGSRALLGWLRLALPPRPGLQLIRLTGARFDRALIFKARPKLRPGFSLRHRSKF